MQENKYKNLINYSIETLENNNSEDVQISARKAIEAFCKFIILKHYGKRGEKIIYSQDKVFNGLYKVSRNKERQQQEFVLSMLMKVIFHKNIILQNIYAKKHDGSKFFSMVTSHTQMLERNLNMLVFNGNSAAHESSPVEMSREDVQTTKNTLIKLLRWLYNDFLEENIAAKLIPYIGQYDIFLSYRHTDKAWVNILKENLELQNYKVFIDDYNIAGRSIEDSVKYAINNSKYGLIVYPEKDESGWLKREFKFMKERWSKGDFKIIPIVLNSSRYAFFKKNTFEKELVHVDFYNNENYFKDFNKLVSGIEGIPSSENNIKYKNLKIPPENIFFKSKEKDNKELFFIENRLKYIVQVLDITTESIAKKLGMKHSLISKLFVKSTGKLKPVHLYAFSKAYNIPMEIFEDNNFDTKKKIEIAVERYQTNQSIFDENKELLDHLVGDWYMYSYPSNIKQAELWEIETTFFNDSTVIDEYDNKGILHIGKNQSIILKESSSSKNITSITFDNYQVPYQVFLFSRVSKSNGVNKEMFNFGIFSKKKMSFDDIKEILGERETVQIKIDSSVQERLSSYIEIN